jgi:hypothetical protein
MHAMVSINAVAWPDEHLIEEVPARVLQLGVERKQ